MMRPGFTLYFKATLVVNWNNNQESTPEIGENSQIEKG